jgi:aspartate kinase
VIIAGFQGINEDENITTMGRGGSDTSAVALAAALNADECRIYTDVEGVYTANPKIVPSAKFLDTVSYGDMIQLASLGAQVLNKRSVEVSEKYGIPISVLSSFKNANKNKKHIKNETKTIVCEIDNNLQNNIKGITLDNNIFLIKINNDEKVTKLVNKFSKEKIIVTDVIYNQDKVEFFINKSFINSVQKILSEVYFETEKRNANFKFEENISKISIISSIKEIYMEITEKILKSLKKFKIRNIIIGEYISIIVLPENAEEIIKILHARFFKNYSK